MPWKELNSPFQHQEYQSKIPKSRTRRAEKREEEGEKEHRQLQSVHKRNKEIRSITQDLHLNDRITQ